MINLYSKASAFHFCRESLAPCHCERSVYVGHFSGVLQNLQTWGSVTSTKCSKSHVLVSKEGAHEKPWEDLNLVHQRPCTGKSGYSDSRGWFWGPCEQDCQPLLHADPDLIHENPFLPEVTAHSVLPTFLKGPSFSVHCFGTLTSSLSSLHWSLRA